MIMFSSQATEMVCQTFSFERSTRLVGSFTFPQIWRSSLLSNYSYSCKLYVFVAFSFKYFVFVLYKEEVTSHNINVVKPLLLGVSFVSSWVIKDWSRMSLMNNWIKLLMHPILALRCPLPQIKGDGEVIKFIFIHGSLNLWKLTMTLMIIFQQFWWVDSNNYIIEV